MKTSLPRRGFIKSVAATGAALGTGDFGFLSALPRVVAADGPVDAAIVRFRPEIEPLVRVLEDTSRERLLEEVGVRIKNGTRYRDVLAALLLAGVRNIQPRPVGFKFHAVLVIHSAHLASQNSPDADRWLPVFWALDQFKSSQARDVEEGDWTMGRLDEKAVPAPDQARREFAEAMDHWDVARADVAVAGLARGAGAQEIFDWFCRYGARDFRDIGHKAIFVANSWRTLQTIGWHHAEPVLRSLAYALLEHEGESPAQRDEEADRPGRRNHGRVREIRSNWQAGLISADATREMLITLRTGDWEQAGSAVVALLNRGIDPQSLWDAFFQAAAEMLMRQPGIVSLHAGTTTNALHYAWQHCFNDETRRFLMLQNASFLTLFRKRAGANSGILIDEFEPAAGTPTLDQIFEEVDANKPEAARRSLAWLQAGGGARSFMDAAQRLIYLKGTDSHDYKFSSAVIEDYAQLSPTVRDRFLAASVFWLKGSAAPDSPLIGRTRAALGT